MLCLHSCRARMFLTAIGNREFAYYLHQSPSRITPHQSGGTAMSDAHRPHPSRKSKRKGVQGAGAAAAVVLSNTVQQQHQQQSSETDPLLPESSSFAAAVVVGEGLSRSSREVTESHSGGSLRSRRSSRSPPIHPSIADPQAPLLLQKQQQQQQQQNQQHSGEYLPMNNNTTNLSREIPPGSGNERTYHSTDSTTHTSYTPESPASSMDDGTYTTTSSSHSGSRPHHHRHVVIPISRNSSNQRPSITSPRASQQQPQQQLRQPPNSNNNRNLPLLEIPEEVYAVRTSALQVLKPLTASWVVISVGFSMTVLFGMSRWTRLLPNLPFWFILLPAWLSHVTLFYCHLRSASALSHFITEANENRQLPDSRDHLDRTEYLPLLQRSLKFGLKTGVLSFFVFVFEILIYIRIANDNSITLTAVLVPIWLLVTAGIVDGIICRTQHLVRVLCWMLIFAGMVLTVMKVDYGYDGIRWRVVVGPFVSVLSLLSAMLIYIIYGHQVGYYRLTESQLTAGNLYSLAALICIVLVVVIGELIPLSRPIEIGTKLFIVVMAPLAVTLVGMGAWVISQDEFGRLLLYGGQSAVHPMKLRWEPNGWTCVQSKGVTIIPMFGEVSFRPLEKQKNSNIIELCRCCSCYPYEDDDEETLQYMESLGNHSYIASAASRSSAGGIGRLYTAPSGL